MERRCFLLKVKPGRLQDYLDAHDVWQELLDVMREAGLRNYSMFYRPDGLLVGYLEGEDIQASLAKVAASDVSARWEAKMGEFFEAGPVDPENSGYEWLTGYFHMD